MPGDIHGFGGATVGGNEKPKVRDNVQIGTTKYKRVTEKDLGAFRKGEEEGGSIDEVLEELERTHIGEGYQLPDENSLKRDLEDETHIDQLMEGETRLKVYLVVRNRDQEKGDYARILLRKEGDHYKVEKDAAFGNKYSGHLQPKDKIVLAEGGPKTNS